MDHTIAELHEQFVSRWNSSLGSHSIHLTLDGTWPSLAILDLVVRLLPEPPLNRLDTNFFVRGISVYLACCAQAQWVAFDSSASINDGPGGIVLRTNNTVAGETVPQVFHVERAVSKLIDRGSESTSQPAEHEPQTLLQLAISLYTCGLQERFDALSQAESDYIGKCFLQLSESCAAWYARVYPSDPIGQWPGFYPMELFLPGCNVADLAMRFYYSLSERGLSRSEMLLVAGNLTIHPLEPVSDAGAILYTALAENLPKPSIIAAAQAKGWRLSILRRQMLSIRAQYGQAGDWLFSPSFGPLEKIRYELEHAMGFLPWFYLDTKRLNNIAEEPLLRETLVALASLDLGYASTLLDRQLAQAPADHALRFLRVRIALGVGDADAVSTGLQKTEAQSVLTYQPRYHDLLGIAAFTRQDAEAAVKHFEEAARYCRQQPQLLSDITFNYAQVLILQGDFQKAMVILHMGVRRADAPVWPLFYKALAFLGLGLEKDSKMLEVELLQIAPFDARVFSKAIESEFFAVNEQPPLSIEQSVTTANSEHESQLPLSETA